MTSMLSSRRYCKNILILAGAIPLACAIGLFFDWQRDNAVLRKQAMAVTAGLDYDSARIRAVNDWVYHNKGFEPNNQYFIIPVLGPTPVQVMERGGYCADKSRLVAALLNRLGIGAGLVMISPRRDCRFIHTVVEARYEGGRMVVDPTWDVDYPTRMVSFSGSRISQGQTARPRAGRRASVATPGDRQDCADAGSGCSYCRLGC